MNQNSSDATESTLHPDNRPVGRVQLLDTTDVLPILLRTRGLSRMLLVTHGLQHKPLAPTAWCAGLLERSGSRRGPLGTTGPPCRSPESGPSS